MSPETMVHQCPLKDLIMLMHKADPIYTSCIEQFWTTAKAKNINGEAQIHAKVDGKKVIISKASIRRDLSVPIEHVVDEAVNEKMDDSLERATTTRLVVEHDRGNISKTQSKETPNEPSSLRTSSGGGPMHQDTIGDTIAQTRLYNVGLSARVESPVDEARLNEEDAFKQGRISDIDANQDIYLVNVHRDEDIFAADKEVGVVIEVNVASITTPDKGKGIMVEEPVKLKKKYQILFDEEVARKLQEQNYKKDRLVGERTRQEKEANNAEKEKLFMELLKKRRKFFAAKRVDEKRNKPPTKAQQRSLSSTYLKNMDGWKTKALKGKSFVEIQKLFNKSMARINNFVDFRTKLVEESTKKDKEETVQESSLKRVGDGLEQKNLRSRRRRMRMNLQSLRDVWKQFQMMEMM
nr:hypothetical protein [Tanacetum cinerariifolium]